MRRPNADHLRQPFRVHSLAPDFELLDVWRYPVEIESEIPLRAFLRFVGDAQAELIGGRGPVALLFRLRGFLGRIFSWDANDSGERIVASHEESVARRLGPGDVAATEGFDELAPGSTTGFRPVLLSERECLTEIRNETVHALMHIGRVETDSSDGKWAPQMAVYVKPQGLLGRAYMSLISPFRHYVVYPAMMRSAGRNWPRYAAARGWESPAKNRA